ncbi:uncharacterized protein L201_007631 [Kwoniella dendrophila CBS 6074]|uniref:37S ribosomal protein S25, mitochondrial n=1 Tax=Kwoniella dendrophila CBS 6074 TaxID=1295534 RepID=A0AAX4K4W7_9TREE
MAKPSPQSATRIIQSLLSSNSHLNTQQIYQAGTEGLRPILQPAHVIDSSGRIRMKKVSNMREGRRPWIPMPMAPYPDHPFKSVNFLKRTILTSLESQGLIHKARIERPIETEEERQDAIQNAMRLTRKDERTALRLRQPVPSPRIPKITVSEYAWKMGPPSIRHQNDFVDNIDINQKGKGKQIEIEDDNDEDFEMNDRYDKYDNPESDRELALRMQRAWEKNRGESLGLKSSQDGQHHTEEGRQTKNEDEDEGIETMDEEMKRRWDQAVRLEEKFIESQIMEQKQIELRQNARRAAFKLDREQKKREKLEDKLAGRTEFIQAEKKRIEALEAIENYAKQTGEDVSDWYKELGIQEGEEIPINEDVKRKKRTGGGFGLKRE